MKRRLFLWTAALAAVCVLPAMADEKKEAIDELRIVEVLNGTTFAKTELKAEYKLVAQKLALPGATYQVDGEVLRIGVQIADADNKRLIRIDRESDCPDNTQFSVGGLPLLTKKWDAKIKGALFVWTQHRHDDFSSKLRLINVGEIVDDRRNFDIQLDLSRVSRLFIE